MREAWGKLRALTTLTIILQFYWSQCFAAAAPIKPKEEDVVKGILSPVDQKPLEKKENKLLERIDGLTDVIPSHALNCVEEELMAIKATELEESGAQETWLSNSGVVADYYLKASQNPCFAVLLEDYYSKVKKKFSSLKIDPDQGDRVNSRPALNSGAGSGSFKEIEKGELWQLALETTAGDSDLAMELIGYCGHDDQFQNFGGIVVGSEGKSESLDQVFDFLSYKAEKSATANAVDADSFDQALELIQDANKAFVSEMKDAVSKGKNFSLQVACPKMTSHFYAPGAVSEELMLPDDLIQKIARLQSPTKGASALPGKAYHGNFAALLSCRLKTQCGLTHSMTHFLVTKLAKAYRAVRLNALANKYMKVKELIEETFDLNWNDEQRLTKLMPEIQSWVEDPKNKQLLLKYGLDELFSGQKRALNWEKTKEYIDTAILYRGGINGKTFTAIPLSAGRDPFHDPDYHKIHGVPQTSYCPGWSEERCDKARNRHETWMVDFEWTEKQQELGIDFAYKNCGKGPTHLDKNSCQALKKHMEKPIGGPQNRCLNLLGEGSE